MPRSEWCTNPGNGFRVSIAISIAQFANRLASVRYGFQPMILRESTSKISASR
jgi:hypothetical protein